MQDKDIKIKPVPSKLFMYETLYDDLYEMKNNYNIFSISEFACGASKLLGSINPIFYQGIDLREDLIEESKKKYQKENYDFFVGNMIDFKSEKKTTLGLCIQTFGINIDFEDNILMKCLNNLNDHILDNGSIIFNLSNELYLTNKKEIDDFCYNNYSDVKNINYGIFNNRYHYQFTRVLKVLEKFFSLKLKYKKYVYIKCMKKKSIE